MKLITETVEDVKYLFESSENGKKKLYIEGPFLFGDKPNKNGRMYEMRILRKEAERYIKECINEDRALGELQHPSSASINLDRVSHKILSLKEDGNVFVGKALILETPCGQIAKNLIEGGVKLGVSSRGLGSVVMNKEGFNVVQDDFRLMTVADIVSDPSGPTCFVNGIMEGKEFWYDQAKDSYIEQNVEQLYTNIKKLSSKQIEEQALKLFEWYLNGISKK